MALFWLSLLLLRVFYLSRTASAVPFCTLAYHPEHRSLTLLSQPRRGRPIPPRGRVLARVRVPPLLHRLPQHLPWPYIPRICQMASFPHLLARTGSEHEGRHPPHISSSAPTSDVRRQQWFMGQGARGLWRRRIPFGQLVEPEERNGLRAAGREGRALARYAYVSVYCSTSTLTTGAGFTIRPPPEALPTYVPKPTTHARSSSAPSLGDSETAV